MVKDTVITALVVIATLGTIGLIALGSALIAAQ